MDKLQILENPLIKYHWKNIRKQSNFLIKNDCKYIAMYFFEQDKVFVIELKNMYSSLIIVNKMSNIYTSSFHLIIGNSSEIASLQIFKLKLKQQRNPINFNVLNTYLPFVLINIIL